MILNSERVHARSGVLVVQQARLEDAGRYVCHANNTAGSERVELEVSIINGLSIRLSPQQVRIIYCYIHVIKIFTYKYVYRTLHIAFRKLENLTSS